ncbi:MAG TPA: SulP family inorganic anion transporter [Alphaproteobacteria bacterium]|jgi:SulP family sulfate permease|nr:SulP family inorganic anion transporter [Alphaproteobacteria bacterium]
MFQRLKTNWKSGITVALVSVPLSLSLAVASGANPVQGIITAVWAGVIAAILGGSSYNIIGPAGALSGILASFALRNGFELLPSIAVISGILILIAYILKLEKYLVFIPSSAVHGFTLGVAFMIIWGQFNSALGLRGIVPHEKFLENFMESMRHIGGISIPTLAVFIIFLAALFLILKFIPKIPGVLVVAPLGIILGHIMPTLVTLGSKFPTLSGELFGKLTFVYSPDLIKTSLVVAIVAILETMLSAKVADNITKTKYIKRKEMLGLGFANIVSGIFGGIPATGVLARTSLNIKSGATSKASALINSISIAVVSVFLLSYFRYMPLAVIAAILTFVAIRMIQMEHFVKMWSMDRLGFWISILVTFITVFDDPSMAILVGTSISLLLLVEKISHGQFELILNHNKKGIVHKLEGEYLEQIDKKGDTLVYSIKGQLLHLNTHAHLARFEKGLNGYKNIIIRLRELYFVDLDGVECISEIIENIKRQKRNVAITGVSDFVREMFIKSPEFLALENEGLIFNKTSEALKKFGYKIK